MDHLLQFGLADRAHPLVKYQAILEQLEGWDAKDSVPPGSALVSVYVQLADFHFAGVFGSHYINSRSNLAAQWTLFGPKSRPEPGPPSAALPHRNPRR
jgi:hypothetical protein